VKGACENGSPKLVELLKDTKAVEVRIRKLK